MSWSLGEVRSLSLKAARGAGLSWGQAEELAFATQWLVQRGLPGAEILVEYLNWRVDEKQYDQNSDPINLLCQISDTQDWRAAFPCRVYQPLLAVPSIASALDTSSVEFRFADTGLIISKSTVSITTMSSLASGVVEYCTADARNGSVEECQLCSRIDGAQLPHIRALEKFAFKTYAPATEQSRSAGAGAGDDGND